ncbi:MAG: hypothetical protein JNM66_24665 [Bryobacterales bacterium]|nr:hypothetical protein [Bryobacterales bacterium]
MKILIDENLSRKLVAHFEGHELAVADPLFDVLLTLDKNLPYQQNLDSVRFAVLIMHAYSNRLANLLPLLPACLEALETIQPRQVIRIGSNPSR